MKPASEWDEAHILGLPGGEFTTTEFKGSRALDFTLEGGNEGKVLDGLSKQLSALANSGGGELVFGVTDTAPGQQRRVDLGGVGGVLRGRSTKEWLEDVIPSLLDAPLPSFDVYQVGPEGSESQIESGKCLVVISVPDSTLAPHQARDMKYYARVGGKSRPIGHRMILDIIGRRSHPAIALEFLITEATDKKLFLTVTYRNVGQVYAQYINGAVQIPTSLGGSTLSSQSERLREIDGKKYREVWFFNIHYDKVGEKPGMAPIQMGPGAEFPGWPETPYYTSRYEPLLPTLSRWIQVELTVGKADLKQLADEHVMWTVYADNAPSSPESVRVGDIVVQDAV